MENNKNIENLDIKIDTETNKEKDKTFNRLKYLQILLKKESALKELCKFLI